MGEELIMECSGLHSFKDWIGLLIGLAVVIAATQFSKPKKKE
jgi:hypothetical protein